MCTDSSCKCMCALCFLNHQAQSGGEEIEKELILRNFEKSDTNRLDSLIEYEVQK